MKVELVFGEWYDEVLVNGRRLDPARSQAVFNHSPDGFAWGYGGSGPAQLALALLLDAGLSNDDAVRLHQDFKFEFVGRWPKEGGEFEINVERWAGQRVAVLRATEVAN